MPTNWQRLLDRLATGDRVFGVDDVRGWRPAEIQGAVELGLLRETAQATSVMCDACAEGHWSDVTWVASGRRAFIVCPQEGALTIGAERLHQWQFDTDRLAELLAAALRGGLMQTTPSGFLA